MAFQSVPETTEIVIAYQGNSVNVVNVINARKVGGYTLAAVVNLADAVDQSVVDDWLPIQVDGWNYESTTVRGLEFVNDVEAINTDGAGPGGVADTALPGNVTVSVKKSSGLTGRTARGRLYWIGMGVLNMDANENKFDTAHIVAVVAAVEAMRAAINAVGWTAVIVSRYLDNVKRATGATFPWIDSVAVNENVDSQRGRLLE